MKASVPIAVKVIFISMFCAALGLGGLMLVNLNFQKTDAQSKAQDENKDLAEILSRQISIEIQSSTDKMNNLAQIFVDPKPGDIQNKVSNYINEQDSLVSFGVYSPSSKDIYTELFFTANQASLAELEISQKSLDSSLLLSVMRSASQHSDSVTVINTSPILKKPIMTLAFYKDKKLYRSEIKTNNLLRYFIHREGLGIYIVDSGGSILLSNGQKPSDSSLFRATTNIGFGLSVIVDSDEAVVYRPVALLQYRDFLVVAMALGLTFVFAFLFSGQLSSPLKALYKSLEKVTAGHFDVNPDVHSNDELGILSLAFKKLAAKLQDRERLKNTLVKFVKAEDVEKILTGEIKLPLEKKSMTILICELHSGLDGSLGAEETIKQVNALWTEVSRAINKYLGFIDKSNGTFMKAIWGALAQVNDEGSSALSAALEIRKAIKNINEKRAVASLQPFEIGIGIHTGVVIAGQIGIEGRTEYSFVGDGPLYATKITAATREVKADILISDETYDLIKNKGFSFGPVLILENFNGIKVHQIIGRKTQDGVTESELSRSEQETILTGSYQMPTQTQNFSQASAQTIIQGPSSISMAVAVPTHSQSSINQSQVNYAQPTPNSQTGYRFDLVTGTNSGIPFQTSSPISNFVVQPTTQVQAPSQPMPAPQKFITPIEEPQWYLMRNPQSGVTEGPFTVNDLRAISEQPGFVATQSYSFRYGDTMMVPLLQVPGVSRREGRTQMPPSGMPLPPEQIQANAKSEDWYVQRDDGQIYGPYVFTQLSGYLESGHISRNTYCWRQGMANWLYAYQVPGLDRRQNGPPPPPIPLPKVG